MDTEWRKQALCHKKNNIFWYPPIESEAPEQYYSIAREVCRVCPVWEKCLEDSWEEKWGMWAGLHPKDRQGALGGRQTLLRSHGTWLRYRQGCRCYECSEAHTDSSTNVNVNVSKVPSMNDPVEDLSVLRFELLE